MWIFNWILIASYAVAYFPRAAESTKCWICYQAKSNRECLIRGHLATCRSTEGCENEVRYSGFRIRITKRCKQLQACSTDQYQNTQISNERYQCGGRRSNSVCRCCCNTDRCNQNQLTCVDKGQPKCRFLFLPNGSTRCYGSADGISVGTRCRFSCKVGYAVKGARMAFCRKTGSLATWSRKLPKCRKRPTCARLLSHSFTNGIVRCSGTSGIATLGTSCVYRCKPRYFMVNNNRRKSVTNYEKTVCTMRKDMPTWSKKAPTCIEEMCPVATNLDHGTAKCSDFNKIGSVCEFSCFAGYDLIGETSVTCVQKPGFKDWSARLPICQPKPCPFDTFLKSLLNVECSHFNHFGSICSITCTKGYYMAHPVKKSIMRAYTATCTLSGSGVDWDVPPPTCIPKKCPRLRSTDDEQYKCTNNRQYLSKCTFECNSPIQYVAGQKVLTCTDDGDQHNPDGVWSAPLPSCEYKQCPHLDAEATNVECSNAFVYNSVCTFSCKSGYYMLANDGLTIATPKQPTKTTCSLIEGEVAWSDAPPRCETKRCPEIIQPESGEVTCTDGDKIGSECSFSCFNGYELIGKSAIDCREGRKNQIFGKWSTPPPVCQRRSCENILHDALSSDLTCTDGFKFESVCTLGCNEGYYMRKTRGTPVIDRLKSACLFTEEQMRWSTRMPACKPKTCLPLTNIANGTIRCSEELIFGAKCEFACNRGFDLSGSRTVTCENDDTLSPNGRWSSTTPTCEPKKCPKLEFDKDTTTARCDNGNSYTSNCDLKCKPNHFIRDPVTKVNIFSSQSSCQLDADDNTYWTPKPKLCQPVSCEAIKPDSDVYYSCTNGNKTNSLCSFSCPVGYDMNGNATNKCMKIGQYDAKWRHPLPTCKVRTCISLVNDEDMNKTCTSDNDYLSTCSFMCAPGRGLFMTRAKDGKIVDSGVVEYTCNIDPKGQMFWTGDLPKCHVKYCLVRRNPPNGRVRCGKQGSKYQSTCRYSCDRGYRMVGRRVITCLEGKPFSPQGEWSADPPRCRRR